MTSGVVNASLSGVQLNASDVLGTGMDLSLSPSYFAGSTNTGWGLNTTLSRKGYGINTDMFYMTRMSDLTGNLAKDFKPSWQLNASAFVGGKDWGYSLNYYGGQYSNWTGSVRYKSLTHENDMADLVGFDRIPGVNGGDKYRSAASRINVKLPVIGRVTIGQEIFTSEYDSRNTNENYQSLGVENFFPLFSNGKSKIYDDKNDTPFRNGIIYAQIGNFRFGSNSKAGGHLLQNGIHFIRNIPHFNWTGDYSDQFYWQYSNMNINRLYK